MKSWALVFIFVAAILSSSQQAEAKKVSKTQKVVVVSFSESELKESRGPASIEDQKEMDAQARHEARLAEVTSYSIPEM